MYDIVFQIPLSKGTTTIGHAEDTIIVTEGISVESIQNRVNAALKTVAGYVESLGLHLTVKITETEIFNEKQGVSPTRIKLQGQKLTLGDSMKYLGMTS